MSGSRINRRASTHPAGMTLIEVLVALVIVSVAVLALARSGGQVLDTQYQLEQRTLAMLVANNVLAEIELSGDASPSQRTGQTTLAGRVWFWRALIQPTPDQAMLRVDVVVDDTADGDTSIVVHTGFVSS